MTRSVQKSDCLAGSFAEIKSAFSAAKACEKEIVLYSATAKLKTGEKKRHLPRKVPAPCERKDITKSGT